MADISKNLKEYLSRTTKLSSATEFTNGNGSSSSWFKSMKSSDSTSNETTNGWFNKAQEDPCLPSLSKRQRVLGFILFLLMGSFCFSLAGLYIPLLLLKARKFVLLYTLGSLFFLFSFALLWGPVNHLKHLIHPHRLPFTAAYLGTMLATIYSSMWIHSTPLTIVCAILQIGTLLWYIISYIPGGHTGLKFFSKIFYVAASKTVQTTLPI